MKSPYLLLALLLSLNCVEVTLPVDDQAAVTPVEAPVSPVDDPTKCTPRAGREFRIEFETLPGNTCGPISSGGAYFTNLSTDCKTVKTGEHYVETIYWDKNGRGGHGLLVYESHLSTRLNTLCSGAYTVLYTERVIEDPPTGGTGGITPRPDTVIAPFFRGDRFLCEDWPVCPPTVFAPIGDHLDYFPWCRAAGARVSCGSCVDTKTPACAPYVGRCKAPNAPLNVAPINCSGIVAAPQNVVDTFTVCTGDRDYVGQNGVPGWNSHVVCDEALTLRCSERLGRTYSVTYEPLGGCVALPPSTFTVGTFASGCQEWTDTTTKSTVVYWEADSRSAKGELQSQERVGGTACDGRYLITITQQ